MEANTRDLRVLGSTVRSRTKLTIFTLITSRTRSVATKKNCVPSIRNERSGVRLAGIGVVRGEIRILGGVLGGGDLVREAKTTSKDFRDFERADIVQPFAHLKGIGAG